MYNIYTEEKKQKEIEKQQKEKIRYEKYKQKYESKYIYF